MAFFSDGFFCCCFEGYLFMKLLLNLCFENLFLYQVSKLQVFCCCCFVFNDCIIIFLGICTGFLKMQLPTIILLSLCLICRAVLVILRLSSCVARRLFLVVPGHPSIHSPVSASSVTPRKLYCTDLNNC